MGYKPYYEGGWKSGEAGGTPITPEALNHMDAGIANADAGNAAAMEYAKKVGAPHNILDNSDFRTPVNQRGQTSYVWTGDGLDRWYTYLVVTVNVGYVRFENTIDESRVLYQRFPLGTIKNGIVYTFAYKRTDGVVKVLTATCGGSSSAYTEDGMRFSLAAGAAGGYDQMANNVLAGSHVDMVWCALYEGEYTAETLPEYQPKGYGAELVECMRYYQIGSVNKVVQLTDKNGALPFSVFFKIPMRLPPTVTLRIGATANVSGAAEIEQTDNVIDVLSVDGASGYSRRGGLAGLEPYRQTVSFVASAEL